MQRLLPLTILITITLALVLGPGRATAQSIDYGALEALFGEPVTLSATGKPQRASEVPASMEIITADQIRRSAATDIPGILRRFAGIDVYRSSANGADVSIRGYSAPMTGRILVLVDGRQIYNDSIGFISWGLLPVELDEIRQIEVVKGPQSALYGFNAAAGVINIITYDPLDTPVNSVRLSGGSQEQRGLSTVVTLKGGNRAAARFSASGFDSRGEGTSYRWFGERQNALDPRRRSFHGDGVVRFDDDSRLRLEASIVTGRERRINSGFLTDLWQDIRAVKGEYSAETAVGLITARAYHNQFRTDVDIPDLLKSPLTNSATVVSLQDLFKLGANNSIRLAAEFRRDQSTVVGNPAATLHYDVWSGSALWDSALSETLTLVNAARFDRLQLGRGGPISAASGLSNADFNRTINEVSFNSGLVWRVDDLNTARLIAGRGLNLPSLYNLGAFEGNSFTTRPDGVPKPSLIYGSPAVNPTVVWNYELSWDRGLPDLGAQAKAGVFYQHSQGLVDFAPAFRVSNGIALLPFVNYGDSRTAGIELGITGHVGPAWTWGLNYTAQTIWEHYTQPDRFPMEGNAGRTPLHKINARVGYTADNWEFDLDLHYVSRYAMPDITQDTTSATRGMRTLGNILLLEPRIGYHITPAITAELSAQGLWPRWELPATITRPSVLFSLVGRW
ncbi:MAG: TonB-dependent receptor [Rhodospirillaceae bacterium]